MAGSEKDKREEGGAPPVGLADGSGGGGFSLERFEALQETLGQIGQSAAAASGAGGVSLTAGASIAVKVGLAILVSLLGVGASQLALKHDQARSASPFLPAPAGVDKNGFQSSAPSGSAPGDPASGGALTPPTGFTMGSVPAKSDDQMVADAQKEYEQAVEAAKAAMAPGVPQASHLKGAPSAFKSGLPGAAALQGGGAVPPAGAPGGGAAAAAPSQEGLAKALAAERAVYAAKLHGHGIGSRGGGRAFEQLTMAERRSRNGAHGTTGEAGAHAADSAFANNIGAGSPIGGSGLALGGAGVTNGRPPASPSAAGPSEGAPIQPAQAPKEPDHKNATPWQKYVNFAKYLLMAASAMLMTASILGWLSNTSPDFHTKIHYRLWAYRAARLAMYLGVVVALLGGLMLGMGQMTQGLIFTLSGALVGYLAHLCAEGMKPPANAEQVVNATSPQVVTEAGQNVGYTAHWSTLPDGLTGQGAVNTLTNVNTVGAGYTWGAGVGGAVAGGGGVIGSTGFGGAKPDPSGGKP